MPAEPVISPTSILAVDQQQPRPGVTLVAACMNRQRNLMKVLPSWLATEADEIVIVDWSSTQPLWPTLLNTRDPRLRVIRIDGEARWILTNALNVGLRMATRERVFKLDCDIELAPDFIASNRIADGEFVRGFWKAAVDAGQPDQKYINGTFGAFKKDLRAVGYYDERIVTYGWDDSDLYSRLTLDLGLAGKLIAPGTVRHLDQEEAERLEHQDVPSHRFVGQFESTEFENSKNKFLTLLSPPWNALSRCQDFELHPENESAAYLCGRRTTELIPADPHLKALAETLAARELLQWTSGVLPSDTTSVKSQLELGRLLSGVHRARAGERFAAALTTGRGIHFIRCPEPLLQPSIVKTVELIAQHDPSLHDRLVIVEAAEPLLSDHNAVMAERTLFGASGRTIDALSATCGANVVSGAGSLEQTLREVGGPCTRTTVSFDSLVDEALLRIRQVEEALGTSYSVPSAPVANSALVASLYDEDNLLRLVEYVSCVALNLRVFECILVCYESRTGVLYEVLRRLVARLALPLGRFVFVPCDGRPTIGELFGVQQLLPEGTMLAVANADVAFDESLATLNQLNLRATIVAVSRWDVRDGGYGPALVRYENGTPNILSSDAWVTATPFAPDFPLDYRIGTMQCDSFLHSQIERSGRYTVVNPCFDVKIFHLHDERFNSSAEKQRRDQREIEQRYANERARNGDLEPVKGVAWSTLAGGSASDHSDLPTWRPKALVLDMADTGVQLGSLILLHLLRSHVASMPDVMVIARLPQHELHGAVGGLLTRYQRHFGTGNLLLDVDDQPFDATLAATRGVVVRSAVIEDVVEWVRDGDDDALRRRLFQLTELPPGGGARMVRADLRAGLDTASHIELIRAVASRHPLVLDALGAFADSLEPWSAERRMLVPFVYDLAHARAPLPEAPAFTRAVPRVSFVTSLFRGREFLGGYLENVLVAARHADGEVIIVDANGDQSDAIEIRRFIDTNPDAARLMQLVTLDADPGLYNCWRLAIERSRAPLITNANLDDRRSPWHTAHLVALLERHPEYAGACGSISCVKSDGPTPWFKLIENQVWFHGEGSRAIGLDDLYVVDEHDEVRSRSVMHCMPVWRKALHERHGYFDEERYGTSADWAFWLKCAKAGERFFFSEDVFGRYFLNPSSHNRRNDPDGVKELRIIEDLLGRTQSRFSKQ
jgi:hypothetical protein